MKRQLLTHSVGVTLRQQDVAGIQLNEMCQADKDKIICNS